MFFREAPIMVRFSIAGGHQGGVTVVAGRLFVVNFIAISIWTWQSAMNWPIIMKCFTSAPTDRQNYIKKVLNIWMNNYDV